MQKSFFSLEMFSLFCLWFSVLQQNMMGSEKAVMNNKSLFQSFTVVTANLYSAVSTCCVVTSKIHYAFTWSFWSKSCKKVITQRWLAIRFMCPSLKEVYQGLSLGDLTWVHTTNKPLVKIFPVVVPCSLFSETVHVGLQFSILDFSCSFTHFLRGDWRVPFLI
jgi:hypothetical protein